MFGGPGSYCKAQSYYNNCHLLNMEFAIDEIINQNRGQSDEGQHWGPRTEKNKYLYEKAVANQI